MVTLVWTGWTLIFCSAPHSVLNAQTRQPATVEQRGYYVAAAMVTVGNTEYVPNGPLWHAATVLDEGMVKEHRPAPPLRSRRRRAAPSSACCTTTAAIVITRRCCAPWR